MTRNKETVQRYIDGFNQGNHEQILSCLTDDIEWTVFGQYHVRGKQAYDEHIAEPGFSTPPEMRFLRVVEEEDTVMAELYGEVRSDAGDLTRMAMAEVFRMRDGLICERRAFVVLLTENDYK